MEVQSYNTSITSAIRGNTMKDKDDEPTPIGGLLPNVLAKYGIDPAKLGGDKTATVKTKGKPMHTFIRWLIRKDLRTAVCRIDRDSFDHNWNELEFITLLTGINVIGMVAERDEKIVGYFVYRLHKGWIELIRFAVDPDCRRQGVGRAMAQKVIDKLVKQRRAMARVEVPEHDLAAQLLFREMGFRAEMIRRGDDYDSYVMEFVLDSPAVDGGNRITDAARSVWPD